jgi:hypothetical protein
VTGVDPIFRAGATHVQGEQDVSAVFRAPARYAQLAELVGDKIFVGWTDGRCLTESGGHGACPRQVSTLGSGIKSCTKFGVDRGTRETAGVLHPADAVRLVAILALPLAVAAPWERRRVARVVSSSAIMMAPHIRTPFWSIRPETAPFHHTADRSPGQPTAYTVIPTTLSAAGPQNAVNAQQPRCPRPAPHTQDLSRQYYSSRIALPLSRYSTTSLNKLIIRR